MKTKELLKERLKRIGEITPKIPLPLDLRPLHDRIETKEELVNLIGSMDEYEFSRFLFWLKFLLIGEEDPTLWRFSHEREIFKGESDPWKRLKLLLASFGSAVSTVIYELSDVEAFLNARGKREVDRLLALYSSKLRAMGWSFSIEGDLYVFRRIK